MSDSTAFQNLFAVRDWGFMTWQFAQVSDPPRQLIANVNMVPFVGDDVVVIHLSNGKWEIPGGTLEPNEAYLQTITRELLEEAGAKLISFTPFGAWECQSRLERPYRPHLPHPHFFRLTGYGDVEIVTTPTIPQGGEDVDRVEVVTINEAATRFRSVDRADLADLYLLAAQLRGHK
jgi:8-oxo-dGTP pyrophosphatase MutT (NUDIX family)